MAMGLLGKIGDGISGILGSLSNGDNWRKFAHLEGGGSAREWEMMQQAKRQEAQQRAFAEQMANRFKGPAQAPQQQELLTMLARSGIPEYQNIALQAFMAPQAKRDTSVVGGALVDSQTGEALYTSPGERQVREDPNGIPRYMDTGEPVFPGIEKTAGLDETTFFGNPMYAEDATGALRAYQLGNRGIPKEIQLGEGVTPLSPYETNYQRVLGQTDAKRDSEVIASLPDAAAKTQQSISLIDQLAEHPGLGMAVGRSSVFTPLTQFTNPSVAGFGELLKQIQGQNFLEAFETLKGGGQITQVEGEKATQAIARLGTLQSETDFKKALQELRDLLLKGQARLEMKVQQAGGESSGWSMRKVP